MHEQKLTPRFNVFFNLLCSSAISWVCAGSRWGTLGFSEERVVALGTEIIQSK